MYFLQKSLAYHVRKLDRWEVMGGKSSLIFYKTTDDRFVLRQILRFEYQAFLNFASLSNSGMITEFLIIENLFYNKKISRSLDFKGGEASRASGLFTSPRRTRTL